jgi:hypothetical protein
MLSSVALDAASRGAFFGAVGGGILILHRGWTEGLRAQRRSCGRGFERERDVADEARVRACRGEGDPYTVDGFHDACA